MRGLWIQAPFYGIAVSTSDNEHASFMIDRPYARCGPRDFKALLAMIRTGARAREGCERRFLAGNPDNPDGLCRAHWKRQLALDVVSDGKDRKARVRRENTAARKRGRRWRAEIWIHLGGDDVYVTRFFKNKPTPSALAKIAKSKRSKILNDVRLVRL